LIELIVATSVIVILSLVAVSMGDLSNQRDREARLRQALIDMRSAIDRYHSEKGKAPASMGALLAERDLSGFPYLRVYPENPVATGPVGVSNFHWQVATQTFYDAAKTNWMIRYPGYDPAITIPAGAGIVDIRSHAGIGNGINNVPYEKW